VASPPSASGPGRVTPDSTDPLAPLPGRTARRAMPDPEARSPGPIRFPARRLTVGSSSLERR